MTRGLGLVLVTASLASAATWGANYFPNVPLTTQDGKTVRGVLRNVMVPVWLPWPPDRTRLCTAAKRSIGSNDNTLGRSY